MQNTNNPKYRGSNCLHLIFAPTLKALLLQAHIYLMILFATHNPCFIHFWTKIIHCVFEIKISM